MSKAIASDHVRVLTAIIERPHVWPPQSDWPIVRQLQNFQLIRFARRGFIIDDEGIEFVVRYHTPRWVRDMIKNARRRDG